MKNKTNKILLGITIFLFLLVLYEAFFIFKIKADKKAIAAEIPKNRVTTTSKRYEKNSWNTFGKFDYNSGFGSEFSDWEDVNDLELYNLFTDKLTDHIKKELKSGLGIDIDEAINSRGLQETKSEYIANIAIPNIDGSKIDVQVKNGNLIVSGNYSNNEEGDNYFNKRSGSFKKILSVPENIDENKVSSKYNSGILTIIMPKIKAGKEINLI